MRLFLNIGKANGGADNWIEPELDDVNELALNSTFDNLLNPSAYVSEYSFSVKVKRTPKNEILFGNITRLDSINTPFNPTKRYEYVIISDFTDIISRGSCYVDFTSDDEISLDMLGSLNYIFSKLLKAGWDGITAAEDSDYTLLPDYTKYMGGSLFSGSQSLNRRLVYTSWMVSPDVAYYSLDRLMTSYNSLVSDYGINLKLTDNHNAFVSSIIGFLPSNQGKYDDFSSDKWIYYFNNRNSVLNVLADNDEKDYEAELTERQICEYRSYYQKPFVYVNKLFQIYQRHFSDVTGGWTLNLDGRWFNSANPMYVRPVYVLPNLFDSKSESGITGTTDSDTYILRMPGIKDTLTPVETTFTGQTDTISEYQTASVKFEGRISFNVPQPWLLQEMAVSVVYSGTNPLYFNFYEQSLFVTLKCYVGNIQAGQATRKFAILPVPNTRNSSGEYVFNPSQGRIDELSELVDEVIVIRYTPQSSPTYDYNFGEFQVESNYVNQIYGEQNVRWEAEIEFEKPNVNNFQYFPFMTNYANTGWHVYSHSGNPTFTISGSMKHGSVSNGRSGSALTMERLFNGTNPFGVLLKYTKMFDLLWVTDDYAKTVTVVHRYDYFYDCMTTDMNSKIPSGSEFSYMGMLDLTRYIDIGRNYEARVPSWDTHTVTFNFGESDEQYAKTYKEKYNRDYGSKIIITENQKNADNRNLFNQNEYDRILPPVMSTEIITPVRSILTGSSLQMESEGMVSNLNDGKTANITDRFFIRMPNGEWSEDVNSGWRDGYCYISDDIQGEYDNGVFCWHGGSETNSDYIIYQRPVFNNAYGDKAMMFGLPKELYAPTISSVRYDDLYTEYWKNYIEEMYSADNKKLVAWVRMPAMMYRRLKTNPLVTFENCAYLVAEIDSWNENADFTKCTLVQIGDINTLTNHQLYGRNELAWDDTDIIAFDDGSEIEVF